MTPAPASAAACWQCARPVPAGAATCPACGADRAAPAVRAASPRPAASVVAPSAPAHPALAAPSPRARRAASAGGTSGRAARSVPEAAGVDAVVGPAFSGRLAGTGVRLAALTIDVAAVVLLAGVVALWTRSPVVAAAAAVELLIVLWMLHARAGAGLGAAILGLRVSRPDAPVSPGAGRALLRGLVLAAGAIVFVVGMWVVEASSAWDRRGRWRSWADRAAGTIVVALPAHLRAGDLRAGGSRAGDLRADSVRMAADREPAWVDPPVVHGSARAAQPLSARVAEARTAPPAQAQAVRAQSAQAQPAQAAPVGPRRRGNAAPVDAPALAAPSPAPAAPEPAPATPAPAPAAPEPVPTVPPVQPPLRRRRSAAPAADADRGPGVDVARVVVLAFDTGQRVRLPLPTAVNLGRSPEASARDDELVAIDDPDRTVSKTHARLECTPEGTWVTDLGSTNGTDLITEDGRAQTLPARLRTEVEDGVRVRIGDRILTLTRFSEDAS